MSRLSVGQLRGLPANSNVIEVPSGHTLDVKGTLTYRSVPNQIRQVLYVRSDTRVTYSGANSGDGTTITDLAITVTPEFSTSRLIIQWMINGETNQDTGILVHRNGVLITDIGAQGYNASVGNIRSSSYTAAKYDNNDDSTPATYSIQYSVIAGSTSPMTFAPAIRATNNATRTFALNRTINGSTGDSHESMVSTGILWEIAQ